MDQFLLLASLYHKVQDNSVLDVHICVSQCRRKIEGGRFRTNQKGWDQMYQFIEMTKPALASSLKNSGPGRVENIDVEVQATSFQTY